MLFGMIPFACGAAREDEASDDEDGDDDDDHDERNDDEDNADLQNVEITYGGGPARGGGGVRQPAGGENCTIF